MTREDFEAEIELILDSDTGSECTPQVDALMACYDDQREEIRLLSEQVNVANKELLTRGEEITRLRKQLNQAMKDCVEVK